MTADKPTINDLIEWLESDVKAHQNYGHILETLRAHKAIMEAKRPEPVQRYRHTGSRMINADGTEALFLCNNLEYVWASDYDDLLAAYNRMAAERDEWKLNWQALKEGAAHLKKELETTERQLAELQAKHDALVKRLREPDHEMLTACGRRLLRFQDGSTNKSFNRFQWADVRQDAERVLAEFAAVALDKGGE